MTATFRKTMIVCHTDQIISPSSLFVKEKEYLDESPSNTRVELGALICTDAIENPNCL